MTKLKLAIALLERHGEWLAKSGHWNGFSAILFILGLLRVEPDQTDRATEAQADELYRAQGQTPGLMKRRDCDHNPSRRWDKTPAVRIGRNSSPES